MKTIESLVPGSATWLQSRSASKAPAMMGASKYQTRSDLLKQMATGIKEDVDAATQARFDAGHASEAAAREIAEDILCDGLSPVCGESDDGYLTASFDGLTFDGRIGYEHKLWNETLAAAVRTGDLPEEYKIQMDQQILVGGLDYVLFVCSDGTREKMVSMEYRSTNERALSLLAAWRQFDIDLAAFEHVEAAPVAVAAPIKDLPAVVLTVSGELAIKTNFDAWGIELRAFIAKIPEKPSTSQEFADCKAAIAAFKKAEAQLDAEESRVLSLVPDVDKMKRDKQVLRELSSTTRLALEKLVARREIDVKVEIMQEGKDALATHIAWLNKRLAKVQMPPVDADFAAAIKSKRNPELMRDAVSALVANKKIEASAIADRITINLQALHDGARPDGADYTFLFSDFAQLILKAPDDLALVIKMRINEHKGAEAKKLEAIKEAARVEAEANAAAKAKVEADAKAKAEQEETERQRKAAEDAAAPVDYMAGERSREPQPGMPGYNDGTRRETREPAAQSAPASPCQVTAAVATQQNAITGTAKQHDLIDDLLRDFTAKELDQVVVLLRGIKSARGIKFAA